MKKMFVISGLMLTLVFTLFLFGCGVKVEKFGDAPVESDAKVSVGTILVSPQNYLKKSVVVSGTISSECPSGCWINVKDDSGAVVYVEMQGADFSPIPQRVGKKVIVKGMVYQTEDASKETRILGKGLVIK
jgi:hypothetical protein